MDGTPPINRLSRFSLPSANTTPDFRRTTGLGFHATLEDWASASADWRIAVLASSPQAPELRRSPGQFRQQEGRHGTLSTKVQGFVQVSSPTPSKTKPGA